MLHEQDKTFRQKMMEAWRNCPPRIDFFACPMPNTPNLKLTGSGCASTTKIEDFIKDLERDMKRQSGHYWVYVMGGDKDEVDTYYLEGWDILTGHNSVYEYTVMLYYSAVSPYMAIKKWMGEDMAEQYLARNAAIASISQALSQS